MNQQNSWTERAKQCMKTLKLSQDELAKKMGITQSAISHYFSGLRSPHRKRFKLMAEALKVDPLWLEWGYNPLPRPTSEGERIQYARQQLNITPQDLAKQLNIDTDTLLRMEQDKESYDDPEQLAKLLQVTLTWLQCGAAPNTSEPSLSNLSLAPQLQGYVPLIGWASAGSWKEALQSLPEDVEMIAVNKKVNQNCYAIRVDGDSMVNSIQGKVSFFPGAIIIIDPECPVRVGSFVIAYNQSKNEAVFKQYVRDDGVDYLKPLNTQYSMIPMTEDYIFLGVIIECTFGVEASV